ncbi:MAG: hypothetical protein B0D86_05080 [Candidatus Sedimenticola endophacoides]|nr:MAG: hypothetical protein B0D86_05080 [Candidatus Sedimenticola endophacoides]
MGVIFRSGRDGYEAVRSGGDSPFEEKELLRMAGFMSQTLSMGDTLLGEPGLRGFLSVSGRLHGEGVQMVWRAVEAGDFDAILLIVASPASMKLSQHALETWLKQHGLDT